jgi:hypothetical protein
MKSKYKSVKLYKSNLSPIEEEYTDPYKQPFFLSRESSTNSQSNVYNNAVLIDYDIDTSNYINAIKRIIDDYENDCGIYDDKKKTRIIRDFDYLLKLNDSLGDVEKIKRGLKKIRFLSNECLANVNTQRYLGLIEIFFINIIERKMKDGKRKRKRKSKKKSRK